MSNDGAAALEAWCTKLGVDAAPIPKKLRAAVQRLDANTFSTWSGAKFLYEAELWASRDSPPEYLVVGHAGHGVNSYGLSYYLSLGGLRLIIQVGFGGAYMNHAESCARVNESFAQAARLLQLSERASLTTPPLVVLATDFRGCHWVAGATRHEAERPDECLEQARAWLRAQ